MIGVNAAIASESGGFEGIGFTIPSNMALHISKTLIAHGKVERGWVGVSIQDLTPELAKSASAGKAKGVYVANVVKGGPADKAGLKAKDVIVSYDGKEVPTRGCCAMGGRHSHRAGSESHRPPGRTERGDLR